MQKMKMCRWSDRTNPEGQIKYKRYILAFSILFNALLFALVIANNPPVWYTNDDFRMMTIVSGAYTGTPSADIVFMRYPMGLILSGLYSITTLIPWYGLFTMFCMYVPSCVFCYYLVKKTYKKKCTALGIVLYILLFLLLIQKYICLPQFTLTSAFMGVGAIALIHEMPEKNNGRHIVFATFCAVLSFAVRSKTFYLLLPVIALIIAVRILRDKHSLKKYILWAVSAVAVCGIIFGIDMLAWSRPEYKEFKEFKEVRAAVYDYDSVPGYYENMPFYVSNDINEVTYRAISRRFLDIDDSVNTENMTKIADYMKEIKSNANHIGQRIADAFQNGLSRWFKSDDETVKYCSVYVMILLAACIVLSSRKKKKDIIFISTVAGLLLEITFLEFNGRVMARLVDLMVLAMAVVGTLTLTDIIDVNECPMKGFMNRSDEEKFSKTWQFIITCAAVLLVIAGVSNMQSDLDDKSTVLRETINPRLEALNKYAQNYPDKFFFYDTNDFISCTNYVFLTYDEGTVLNTESTGSWNVRSPSYYERNGKFGFTTSIEGLTSRDSEVYFVTRTDPKMGISKTLKDLYNKKLVEVDKIQSAKDVLYVYMVVDDE